MDIIVRNLYQTLKSAVTSRGRPKPDQLGTEPGTNNC
jgi:hypothetical protein